MVKMLTQLLGILTGVLTRVFLPWVRKLKRGKIHGFDMKYLYSASGSNILGLIVTLLVLPQFQGVTSAKSALESFAIAFGFGWRSIVDEAGKWSGVLEKK